MKFFQKILMTFAALLLATCTDLADIQSVVAGNTSTNFVYITNDSVLLTNLVTLTNIVHVSDSVYTTNTVIVTNFTFLSTNVTEIGVDYHPIPSSVFVYVDSGALSSWGWSSPTVRWWYNDDSDYGDLTLLSNVNDGTIDWWVFELSGIDLEKKFGLKLHDGDSWESINGGNNGTYKRIVTWPILTKYTETIETNATTNFGAETNIYTTNSVVAAYDTYDKIFVYPAGNWYESFPYFFENETNSYADPEGLNCWDQYMGANYWGGGTTFFTIYAPNVRRVWVAGDFNDWNYEPMQLSTDKIWWWAKVENTEGGDAYKYIIEKYEWTNHHYISDPAAKKNEYGPAMDTGGNKSFIVDHSSYQWNDGSWNRPDFRYYTIYQMHMRTFETNGPGDWYGWGTFTTATNQFDYIRGLNFTAVEPLPIFEFAGDQSWGYNYTLYYSPESAYCNPADLSDVDPMKVFVDTAHQKGMAVILDLVFNHMGASDDVIGSIDPAVNWEDPNTYWYQGKTPWGPSFNFGNPVVKKFLEDSAVYMAQYYHVDGFRFDATASTYISDRDWLSSMGSSVTARSSGLGVGGNVIMITENLGDANDFALVESGGFNFNWNVNLGHELKLLFSSGPGAVSVGDIAGFIQQSGAVQYMTSHDEVANGKQRTAADLHYARGWGDSEWDARFQTIGALATVFMSKGVPMMFMGDEQLEGFYDDSYWGEPYNARYFVDTTALSWNQNFIGDEVTNKRWGAFDVVNAVRDLAEIRSWIQYDSIAGFDDYWSLSVTHTDEANHIIGFRYGNKTFVVINYNNQSQMGYYVSGMPDGWGLQFASPSSSYGDGSFDGNLSGYSSSGAINIPPYGVLIYRQ